IPLVLFHEPQNSQFLIGCPVITVFAQSFPPVSISVIESPPNNLLADSGLPGYLGQATTLLGSLDCLLLFLNTKLFHKNCTSVVGFIVQLLGCSSPDPPHIENLLFSPVSSPRKGRLFLRDLANHPAANVGRVPMLNPATNCNQLHT